MKKNKNKKSITFTLPMWQALTDRLQGVKRQSVEEPTLNQEQKNEQLTLVQDAPIITVSPSEPLREEEKSASTQTTETLSPVNASFYSLSPTKSLQYENATLLAEDEDAHQLAAGEKEFVPLIRNEEQNQKMLTKKQAQKWNNQPSTNGVKSTLSRTPPVMQPVQWYSTSSYNPTIFHAPIYPAQILRRPNRQPSVTMQPNLRTFGKG